MTERRDSEEPAFFQMDPSERADTRLEVGRSGGSFGVGAKGSNWLAMVFVVVFVVVIDLLVLGGMCEVQIKCEKVTFNSLQFSTKVTSI